MARAATGDELTLYRTPGKWSKLRCAFFSPPIIYRARINQTFSTYDQVAVILYDGGTGTLADVLPDMEVWIGSTLDAKDKGICRLRDKDGTHFYLSETSEIAFADNDYVSIVPAFGVWARPVRITAGGDVYMDEVAYTDQHTNLDPQPNMGANRALRLVSAAVNTTFDASSSFCLGSSISSYAWSCATASASSGTTTSSAGFSFDTTGWHIVYLTVTAANGKSFFGVRFVYVWDNDNPPFRAEIYDPGKCDVEAGGWSIGITLYGSAGLSQIYDRAMVILFAEDHYGTAQQDIGPVVGSENVRFVGWVGNESLTIAPEGGRVSFTAYGAAHWMGLIPSWPDGVEYVAGTPTDWHEMQNLTMDLGVYHFLRYRSTITRVMDVTLSGDTRLTQEVYSSAQKLWSQIQEMTWGLIYARAGVNYLNQLSIQIHPNLIPSGSRTFPTVMTILHSDIERGIDIDRAVVDEVSIVDMSGIHVTAPNTGSAYFALAPGHSLPHYGDWDIQPNLLLEGQSQVITLAGLYRSWRNSPYKAIPLRFAAPIGLIDCFPNQRCNITIDAADNVRGIEYSGGLIPTSVTLAHDPITGHLHTEVTFEAETSESQSRVGDTPGSGDPSQPPSPSFPPLPLPPPTLPGGGGTPTALGPTVILLHDENKGLVYCTDFDQSIPSTWQLVNGGLTLAQYTGINTIVITPSGAIYVARRFTGSDQFIAWAPSIGAAFTVLEDQASVIAKHGSSPSVCALGVNPLTGQVAYVLQGATNSKIYIGTAGVFAAGAVITSKDLSSRSDQCSLTYGFGKWVLTGVGPGFSDFRFWVISSDASTIVNSQLLSGTTGEPFYHIRAGSTDKLFHLRDDGDYLEISTGNCGSIQYTIGDGNLLGTAGLSDNYYDCDPTGRFIMAPYSVGGGTSNGGRSSDGGFSWATNGSLPVGPHVFAYAGPGDSSLPRFIRGGATVYYTTDFGNTWHNRTGTLASSGLVPLPEIDIVKVITP